MSTLYVRNRKGVSLGTIVLAGQRLIGSSHGVQTVADAALRISHGDIQQAFARLNGYSNQAIWITSRQGLGERAHHVPGTPYKYKHGWIPVAPLPPKTKQPKLSGYQEYARQELVDQAVNHRVNDPLRHGLPGTKLESPAAYAAWAETEGFFDPYDSLVHSGTVSQDGAVFRGIALPEGVSAAEALKPGTVFHDPGYPSASQDEELARQCAVARATGEFTGFEFDENFQPTLGEPVVLEMRLKKGQPVGPGTEYAKELILPRNTRCTVTGFTPGNPAHVTVEVG